MDECDYDPDVEPDVDLDRKRLMEDALEGSCT